MTDSEIVHYGMPQNVWWPRYDKKFEACHKYVMDRIRDMDIALKYVKDRKVALQAGGHVGLWPLRLARLFGEVLTFEPEPVLYRCLQLNINGAPSIKARDAALGDCMGELSMALHGPSSGTCQFAKDGPIKARQITIDSLALDKLDALYLDVEGYEVQAMRGAEQTIRKYRPVIHCELLVRSREGIRAHLASIGYREVARVHGDAVFVSIRS